MSMITENIDRLIIEKGLDKKDVLNTIGITASAYSQWRKEQSYPRYDKLVRAAAALGVHVSDLVSNERLLNEETATSSGGGLNENQKMLIDLFDSLPADRQQAVLRQLQEIVRLQKAQDALLGL